MWLLSAVFAAAAPAVAAEQMNLQWHQLAYYVEGHKLTVTSDGVAPFEGKCLRVDYDGLIFENPNGPVPVKLAKYKVAVIKVSDIGGRQMTRLVNRTGPALNYGRKQSDIFAGRSARAGGDSRSGGALPYQYTVLSHWRSLRNAGTSSRDPRGRQKSDSELTYV